MNATKINRRFTFAVATAAAILTGFTGCSDPSVEAEQAGSPTVATVNYPLAYFAERIGGDHLVVEFPEIDGDPAFWEPKTEHIVACQQADLILLNGANYAKWVPKVSLAQAKLVNTSAELAEKLIPLNDEVTHTHGPGGEHAHGDTAFTTWLDPQLATVQAAAIRDAFAAKWPQHQADFDSGYQALAADLEALDAATAAAFVKYGDAPLLGSHPVYQYLARRYGLKLKSVHWEPDATPDEAMWKELDAMRSSHSAGVMLWEGEPLAETREKLAAKGIKSIVFDPCGNRPEAGDYLGVMEKNIANLGDTEP
jgi:zinc transport system substrate-binding protein